MAALAGTTSLLGGFLIMLFMLAIFKNPEKFIAVFPFAFVVYVLGTIAKSLAGG
jgi:hypothetical protein